MLHAGDDVHSVKPNGTFDNIGTNSFRFDATQRNDSIPSEEVRSVGFFTSDVLISLKDSP